jgi:methionyl-tRNA formyltransferase
VNVHASLLPRHRGAAPIQWSILAGDEVSGVTLMKMDEGLDTGPMLAARSTPIGPDESAGELFVRLSELGASLVREELPRYVNGVLEPVAQDASLATLAPLLTKEMGRINWRKSAREIHAHVRGLQPWPMASTSVGARRLIVHRTTRNGAPTLHAGAPGEVVAVARDRIWVATGEGAIALTEVQLEGKRRVTAQEFLAGHPLRAGAMFGA